MRKTQEKLYLVVYKDSHKRKHMTFVEGLSAVRFLEDNFKNIYYKSVKDVQQENVMNMLYRP